MNHKVEISVYQHPLYEDGTILFEKDALSHLLAECEQLYLKRNSASQYPKEEVELRFSTLFETVSLAKSLCIRVVDQDVLWEQLLTSIKRYYPQLVWTIGKESNTVEGEYWFEFIPLVLNQTSFPFGTSLNQSLIQQGVEVNEDEELIDVWIRDLTTIVNDFLDITLGTNELALAAQPSITLAETVESQPVIFTVTEGLKNESVREEPVLKKDKKTKVRRKSSKAVELPPAVTSTELISAVETAERDLEQENRELAAKVDELTAEIHELQVQSLALTGSPGQKLYYEEALRRESEEKEKMRQTNAKLESLVNRLELQAQTSPFELIESDFAYSERDEDWYKKRTIDLAEYDELYRKAKYLEHTWQVNQHLTVTTERMTIKDSKLTYERERERFNRLKNSAKDIELFVMMDECKMINDRVKMRQGFLWMKPHVKIMNGDYENLVEKANYFDIIHSENKLLEKIIEEHDGDYRRRKR